ncbi:unnamed protein product [Orchesella dallaii]|uniref:Odorant receptor n=1 Tax=Orchesella dallaii TaxID=48710 RepID=A0ABP1RQN4_9HEXA
MGEEWNKGFIRGYLNLLQFTKIANKKVPNVRGFQLYDAHENRFVPYPQKPTRIGSICEVLRDLLSFLVFLVSFIAAFQNLAQFMKTNQPEDMLSFVIHTVIYGVSFEILLCILTWYRDLGTCAVVETAMLHFWLRTRRDLPHPVDQRRKSTKKKTTRRAITTGESLVYISAAVFYLGAPFVMPTFLISIKDEPFGLILGLLPIVRDWSNVVKKIISFSLAVPFFVFGEQMVFMFVLDSFNWLVIIKKVMPSLLPEKSDRKSNLSKNSGFGIFHLLTVYALDMSQKFKEEWNCKLFGKMERMELRACQVVGLQVGPFFVYKRRNFGDWFECVVDYSISMIYLTK